MGSRYPSPLRSWGEYTCPGPKWENCPRLTSIFFSIPYKVHKIELTKNMQKQPWFLEINPNGRISALTDTFTDGQSICLFESGSILQYLADRYDTEYKISYPRGSREAY